MSASSAQDAKLWLDIGNKRRATACTNMNQKSSRSHSVFQITLTQMLEQKSAVNSNGHGGEQKLLQLVTSRINLVDLAGSERINSSFNNNSNSSESTNPNNNKAGSSNNQLTQSRLKESTCINKSLLTLGKIICLLSERQTASNPLASTNTNSQNAAILVNASAVGSSANIHLPYRDSVLTWLLKESLGGNAKTAMLATVCASSAYIDETVCTLRYAAKTACIKTTAHLNRNYRRQYIDEFGRESEMTLILPPMSAIESCCTGNCASKKTNNEKETESMEATIKTMEAEWREKLARAERLKQKEIADLEKSLIVLYANETRSHNCCLINLNEDPSLSEKLIYLLKNDEATGDSVTIIGSDKAKVDIHLSGALLAGQHAHITKNSNNEHFIEQLDQNYLTYVNGDVLNPGQNIKLMHGDRIIFGGSHFFRFNNPSSIEKTSKNNSGIMVTSLDMNQFKDYQFAKNEIERKQNEIMQAKLNEAVNKCKQDGDLKLVEITREYEKNIEKIVILITINSQDFLFKYTYYLLNLQKNDLEKEKLARKIELEQIKNQSQKKLKQIVQKKLLIETKLNEAENDLAAANQEIDMQERELTNGESHHDTISDLNSTNSTTSDGTNYSSHISSACRTPSMSHMANRMFINKLYSEKKSSVVKRKLIIYIKINKQIVNNILTFKSCQARAYTIAHKCKQSFCCDSTRD